MYKKGEEEGYIERTSKTYKELMSGLANANQQVDQMDASYKPGLDGEKYYTGCPCSISLAEPYKSIGTND